MVAAYHLADHMFLCRTIRKWNALPAHVFPAFYNLGSFKRDMKKQHAGRQDTSSSRKHPRKPITVESNSHRPGDFFSRRLASSAISLHLPSTSGHAKIPLSAHRSHEEIRGRRKSHHDSVVEGTRYHSAPSVIDEVLHRRDWERSTRELYIPLNPQNECKSIKSDSTSSPDRAPCAEPESSSIECLKPEEPRRCKKHHTNIKSSKVKKCKESNRDDIKDTDATEVLRDLQTPNFYIGEAKEEHSDSLVETCDFSEEERMAEVRNRSIYKAKDAKQSFNESVKHKEYPRVSMGAANAAFVVEDEVDTVDRSGAVHHTIESRMSFSRPYPPPSVETVGYEGGACYLAEVGSLSELRARAAAGTGGGAGAGGGPGGARAAEGGAGGMPARARHASDGDILAPLQRPESGAFSGDTYIYSGGAGGMPARARHASDGDILAPLQRPESGAFSESDLDIDLEALASEERPPAYYELQPCSPRERETAI
ncbi:hypothetical protein evm_013079 [Chilo suppressalis]|nr:hypothetical protein evm_013079 [Chilo suppressalis]